MGEPPTTFRLKICLLTCWASLAHADTPPPILPDLELTRLDDGWIESRTLCLIRRHSPLQGGKIAVGYTELEAIEDDFFLIGNVVAIGVGEE